MPKVTQVGKTLKEKSEEKAKQLEEELKEILVRLEQNLTESSNSKLVQIENYMSEKVEEILGKIETNISRKIDEELNSIENQVLKKLELMELTEQEHYQINKVRLEVILESLGTTLTLKKTKEGKIVAKEKIFKKKLFGGH